jgi:hypothetical protein
MAILTKNIATPEALYGKYQAESASLNYYRTDVLSSMGRGVKGVYGLFEGMTAAEVYELFEFYNKEAEYSSMLALIASIEAYIRVDFVERRRRTGGFRTLYSQFGIRALFDDILDAWSYLDSIHSRWVSKFRDLLRLRHWLAHGRYWNQNVGRNDYSPELVYEIGIEILNGIMSA